MCLIENILQKKNKSISFLIGTGFSSPMGYPTGIQLNKKILNCINDNFAFSTNGSLIISNDGVLNQVLGTRLNTIGILISAMI